MIIVHPQYVKDTACKNPVILPEDEFDNLMEELADVKLYGEAKKTELVFTDAKNGF